MKNYRIYLSQQDQDVLYIRALISQRHVDQLPANEMYNNTNQNLYFGNKLKYEEGIIQIRFFKSRMTSNGHPFYFQQSNIFSVEATQEKLLQLFTMNEKLKLGFVYDTIKKCIKLIDLQSMEEY